MTTIAVDAMGGDHAPNSEVEGAIKAATAFDVKVILVGREDLVRKELSLHPSA
ncbi:MAG: phosphate--acyl-ACP acyltransferase, partial [Bryobacteraceae bacterium]